MGERGGVSEGLAASPRTLLYPWGTLDTWESLTPTPWPHDPGPQGGSGGAKDGTVWALSPQDGRRLRPPTLPAPPRAQGSEPFPLAQG